MASTNMPYDSTDHQPPKNFKDLQDFCFQKSYQLIKIKNVFLICITCYPHYDISKTSNFYKITLSWRNNIVFSFVFPQSNWGLKYYQPWPFMNFHFYSWGIWNIQEGYIKILPTCDSKVAKYHVRNVLISFFRVQTFVPFKIIMRADPQFVWPSDWKKK